MIVQNMNILVIAADGPCRNSRARRETNTEPANIQSGGAISSITRGDVALIAYALISRVPPPASAIRKPCLEGSYAQGHVLGDSVRGKKDLH